MFFFKGSIVSKWSHPVSGTEALLNCQFSAFKVVSPIFVGFSSLISNEDYENMMKPSLLVLKLYSHSTLQFASVPFTYWQGID